MSYGFQILNNEVLQLTLPPPSLSRSNMTVTTHPWHTCHCPAFAIVFPLINCTFYSSPLTGIHDRGPPTRPTRGQGWHPPPDQREVPPATPQRDPGHPDPHPLLIRHWWGGSPTLSSPDTASQALRVEPYYYAGNKTIGCYNVPRTGGFFTSQLHSG
jgi:hypothetical protein